MSYLDKYSASLKKRILFYLFMLFFLVIGMSFSLSYLNNPDSKITPESQASEQFSPSPVITVSPNEYLEIMP